VVHDIHMLIYLTNILRFSLTVVPLFLEVTRKINYINYSIHEVKTTLQNFSWVVSEKHRKYNDTQQNHFPPFALFTYWVHNNLQCVAIC